MKDTILILIGAAFLLILALSSAVSFYAHIPRDHGQEEVLFFIEEGESVREIAGNLKKEELISHEDMFIMYAFLHDIHTSLQAGAYKIPSPVSISELADMFSSGKVAQEALTVPEGWNLRDIAFSLMTRGVIESEEELFALTGAPREEEGFSAFREEFSFLQEKPQDVSLEGYLFPDTYHLPSKASAEDVVRLMLQNFESKLSPELQEEISHQEKDLFEVLTVASLIEKEVREEEDKTIVSGIIWKRIEAGMPLQIDATITYITGKRDTAVSSQETRIPSLYNTYENIGLPKGPIANPGMESILAALHPQESPYWFYLSTPEGDTIFSETFQEHVRAKEKYLR